MTESHAKQFVWCDVQHDVEVAHVAVVPSRRVRRPDCGVPNRILFQQGGV